VKALKLVLQLFKAVVFVFQIPKKLGRKLQEALDDYAEMAPYRIRMMSMSFSGSTATGLSSVKKAGPGAPSTFDQFRGRDEFTRREMIIWRFIDFDRMMFGKHDPITARQWITLGDLHWEYRHPGEARTFYQRGLKIFRMSCEKIDDRLIAAQKKLANCYVAIGSYADAEVLFREIAEAFELKLNAAKPIVEGTTGGGSASKDGKTSTSVVDLTTESLINFLALAETLKRQKKYLEATAVLNQVVDIYEASGLPSGEDCLSVYMELSSTYEQAGDGTKADLFNTTARQLDFMRVVEKAVGAEARSLVLELEALASLYRKRDKHAVVDALNKRIRICHLVDRTSGPNYPGIEADLESLALLFDARAEGADATRAFHLRARRKRILDKISNKVSMLAMVVAGKLSWLFAAVESCEPMIATALCSLM
jgi:tetratricopeptide (TPR) repeat protein